LNETIQYKKIKIFLANLLVTTHKPMMRGYIIIDKQTNTFYNYNLSLSYFKIRYKRIGSLRNVSEDAKEKNSSISQLMYLETKTRYIMKIISEQTQSKFLTFFFLYFSGFFFFFFGEQNLIISVQI
jgi:hypothetical protein